MAPSRPRPRITRQEWSGLDRQATTYLGEVTVLRSRTVGLPVYAVTVAAMGALVVAKQFVYVWAPIPEWVPWNETIAAAAGAVMAVSALASMWPKTARVASSILAVLFACWVGLLQVPQLIAAPSEEALWAGAAELVTLVAGGWIICTAPRRKARALYAAALPVLGLHHVLAHGAVSVVPAWLPFRPGWLYLTAFAHVAAGVAILLGVVPRMAATLEAIMITAFVVLVHVPGVIGAPGDPLQWTMLVVASAIAGAAWLVADSYALPPQSARSITSSSALPNAAASGT